MPHWFTVGDPQLSTRMRQFADIAAAERQLGGALEQALALYLSAAHARVLSGLPSQITAASTVGVPDLSDWPEREQGWLAVVRRFVFTVLRLIFSRRFRAELRAMALRDVTDAVAQAVAEQALTVFLDEVWSQRLQLMTDTVFNQVDAEIRAGVAQAASAARIRDRVAELLAIDAPSRRLAAQIRSLQATIDNPATRDGVRRQARTRLAAVRRYRDRRDRRWWPAVAEMARTLAVSVLNAATTQAAEYAAQSTGERRLKQWWAIRDDVTRPAHRRAHGQTRDVADKFDIGGFPMSYPGDPVAPTDLTANCRCSVLLLSQAQARSADVLAAGGTTDGGVVAMPAALLQNPTNPHATVDEPVPATVDTAGDTAVDNTVDTTVDVDRTNSIVEAEIVGDTDTDTVVSDEAPVLAAGVELPGELTTIGWTGVLAPMGVRSGDGRMLAVSAGVPEHRDLPLPLQYQQASAPGHDNSVIVGNITRIWAQDGMIMGEGRFDLGDDQAREVVRKISEGFHRWVSIALDDEQIEMQYYRDGEQLSQMQLALLEDNTGVEAVRVSRGRVMSATLVAEPAFQEAWIALLVPVEDDPAIDQTPAPVTADAAGAFAAPTAKERQQAEDSGAAMPGGRYPIRNEADLKKAIKAVGRAGGPSGSDEDRNAVRRHIIKRAKALGLSNLVPFYWGKDGTLGRPGGGKNSMTASAEKMSWYEQVAAAVPMSPPEAWFADPQLTGPTKIRVTDEGRVYGHIAAWDTVHAALPGNVPPPHNPDTAYRKFHRHPVRTAEGTRIKTGPLAGSGHAVDEHGMPARLSVWEVQRHYDDPTYVIANVVVGEDEHGIWCSGALRSGVEAYQVMFADCYSFSGDWRGGELLAACLASVPGFHLDADDRVHALAASAGMPAPLSLASPSPRMRMEDGEVVALIAAGVLPAPRVATQPGVAVAVEFAPDPEEWGRRIGQGMFAGLTQAQQDAAAELAAQAEYERDQVAMNARVSEFQARINAPRVAEVARLQARLARAGVKVGA